MARHDLDNGVDVAMPFTQPVMSTRVPIAGNGGHVGTGSAVGAVGVAASLVGEAGNVVGTVRETPWAAAARIAALLELLVGDSGTSDVIGRVTDPQVRCRVLLVGGRRRPALVVVLVEGRPTNSCRIQHLVRGCRRQ